MSISPTAQLHTISTNIKWYTATSENGYIRNIKLSEAIGEPKGGTAIEIT